MTARKRKKLGAAPRSGAGAAGTERAKATVAKLAAEPKKSKATFAIDKAILHELRVASLSLPPYVIGGSISGLVENAISLYLEDLREMHNGGKHFTTVGPVKTRKGRPPEL